MQPEFAVVHSAVIVRGNGMRITVILWIYISHYPWSVMIGFRVSNCGPCIMVYSTCNIYHVRLILCCLPIRKYSIIRHVLTIALHFKSKDRLKILLSFIRQFNKIYRTSYRVVVA